MLFEWIREHVFEELPLIAGGFAAYLLHEFYHRLFRQPGRLIRAVTRRGPLIRALIRRRP